MDEKALFKSYLQLFTQAEFPLILAYDIDEPESFSDDPLPLPLSVGAAVLESPMLRRDVDAAILAFDSVVLGQ